MCGKGQRVHEALDSVISQANEEAIVAMTARLFDRWVDAGATFNELKKAMNQMSVDDKAKLLLKIREGGEG